MIGMIRRDWNQFFFGQRPATTLGLYRILFGIAVLSWCVLIFPDLKTWYTESGFFNLSAMKTYGADPYGFSVLTFRTWTRNVFGVPLLSDVTSYAGVAIAFWLLVLSAVALTLGYRTRLASILVCALLVSFHHRDMIILNGGDTLMRNMSFLMMFANSGAAISVDRLLKVWNGQEKPENPVLVESWPQRLMQLQLVAVYLSTAMSKISGDEWRDGSAFYYASHLMDLHRFSFHGLNDQAWFFTFATYFSLAGELSLGTLIFVPKLRPYVLLWGCALHAGIEYSMTVPLFSFTIVSCYLNFVPQEWIDTLVTRLHKRFANLSMNLPIRAIPVNLRNVLVASDSLGLVRISETGDNHITQTQIVKAAWRSPSVLALAFMPLIVLALIRPLPVFLFSSGIVWPLLVTLWLRSAIQKASGNWTSDIPLRNQESVVPGEGNFAPIAEHPSESETVTA